MMNDTLTNARERHKTLTRIHRGARSWSQVRWLVLYTVVVVAFSMILAGLGSTDHAQLALTLGVAPALCYGGGMFVLTGAVVLHAFYVYWRFPR